MYRRKIAICVQQLNSVYEGDPIVLMGEPTANADFTQELTFMHAA